MNDKPQDSAQPPSDAAVLRERAEAQVRTKSSPALAAQSPEEIQQMLHELRVHQIELEMQNEELRTAQAVIETLRARYFDLYDLAPVGYCTVSEKGLILEANLTAVRLLGTTRSALVKQPISSFIFKEDEDIYYLRRKKLFEAGEAQEYDLRLVKPDGALFWVHLKTTAAQVDDDALVCRVVFSDISKRKQAEQQIVELNRDFVAFLENTADFIYFKDKASRFRFCSQTLANITGHAHWRDMVGKHDLEVFPAETAQIYCEEELLIFREGRPLLNKIGPYFDASGNKRWMSTSKWPLLDQDGAVAGLFGISRDITERYLAEREHQAQLEYIAHYDALTGLPNRLLLGDRLRQAMSQALRRGQRLAVAYLDLDGFKAVNDTHGHEVGDQLLATLATRMTQVLRDGDTLGRLGGDEFVAVLVDLSDFEASVPILTRLLEAAAQPFPVGAIVLNVSASLGVTFYPRDEVIDADQLMRQADQAMYQAKQAGKNRYHAFDAAQDRDVRGRHESLQHIRQALAEHQFVLHYQPKVNMRTGEILGAEALIRWQHPQRGLLSPAAFLPVVEDHPLAIDLGEWVIDTALTQVDAWRAEGLTIPVSVNVGALQLQHPDFVSRLRALLSRHPEVNPGELELEIVETSALEGFAGVTQVMAASQELGVGFALDDFGTGYSSLTYLKQLPAGVLKVDQSFVRDMLDDPDDLAILEGVLGLATAFRRQVIAEGVETLAHGEMLLRMGCAWAQGYAIARPMPAHDFRGWASTWDAPPTWKVLEPISRDRLPALFASVEHRAWISAMTHYLSGEHARPPEQDHQQCRFGHWLDHGGRNSLLGGCADHPVDTLHREIHGMAAGLIALKRDGRADEAKAHIGELQRLRDQLLEQLCELC